MRASAKLAARGMLGLGRSALLPAWTAAQNHSHFLLVDDGATGPSAFGSELKLRAEMEEQLCPQNKDDDDVIARRRLSQVAKRAR